MKKIKSTVSYVVPHWQFCNSDNLVYDDEIPKETCKFCVKTKTGHKCLLYNETLSVNDGLISKVRKCCKATAGFKSEIDVDTMKQPQGPTVDPREVMKQTIELYDKTVRELTAQKYPRQMAESLAKQYILGGK